MLCSDLLPSRCIGIRKEWPAFDSICRSCRWGVGELQEGAVWTLYLKETGSPEQLFHQQKRSATLWVPSALCCMNSMWNSSLLCLLSTKAEVSSFREFFYHDESSLLCWISNGTRVYKDANLVAYQLATHFVATSDKGTGRKLDGLLLEHGLFYRSGPKKLQPVLLHATERKLYYFINVIRVIQASKKLPGTSWHAFFPR